MMRSNKMRSLPRRMGLHCRLSVSERWRQTGSSLFSKTTNQYLPTETAQINIGKRSVCPPSVVPLRPKNGQKTPCLRTARPYAILTAPCRWMVFKRSVTHFVREDDESMKPPSNAKTPAQYIAALPADRAKTIATVRALVNKHIPRGYDECLVWGTIGWTIPLSRYADTYNKHPISYVALSSQKNYCSLYLMGALWSASHVAQP